MLGAPSSVRCVDGWKAEARTRWTDSIDKGRSKPKFLRRKGTEEGRGRGHPDVAPLVLSCDGCDGRRSVSDVVCRSRSSRLRRQVSPAKHVLPRLARGPQDVEEEGEVQRGKRRPSKG